MLRPHSWGGGEECPALGVQTSPETGAGGCPTHPATAGNRREGKGEAQKLPVLELFRRALWLPGRAQIISWKSNCGINEE